MSRTLPATAQAPDWDCSTGDVAACNLRRRELGPRLRATWRGQPGLDPPYRSCQRRRRRRRRAASTGTPRPAKGRHPHFAVSGPAWFCRSALSPATAAPKPGADQRIHCLGPPADSARPDPTPAPKYSAPPCSPRPTHASSPASRLDDRSRPARRARGPPRRVRPVPGVQGQSPLAQRTGSDPRRRFPCPLTRLILLPGLRRNGTRQGPRPRPRRRALADDGQAAARPVRAPRGPPVRRPPGRPPQALPRPHGQAPRAVPPHPERGPSCPGSPRDKVHADPRPDPAQLIDSLLKPMEKHTSDAADEAEAARLPVSAHRSQTHRSPSLTLPYRSR
jgi:hypothetical protein